MKFISHGDPSLLVWTIPESLAESGAVTQAFAFPLLSRPGGLLLAVVKDALKSEAVLSSLLSVEDDEVLGLSQQFEAPLIAEDEEGGTFDVGQPCSFLVVDVLDSLLSQLREYDPVTDGFENILPFDPANPLAVPKVSSISEALHEWIESVAFERLNFYSAREEQEPQPAKVTMPKKAPATKKAGRITTTALADQLATMGAQMKILSQQYEDLKALQSPGAAKVAGGPGGAPMIAKIPPLSSGMPAGILPKQAMNLVGPPPKTKAADIASLVAGDGQQASSSGLMPESSMLMAINQQSQALTQLVAHLAGGDPLTELGSNSSGSSMSTKGVARREKMQQDLAGRTSNYFLQIQQQLFKRMHPTRICLQNAEDLSKMGVSLTSYLERYGGYKSQREVGLTLWILAHAVDCASAGDFDGTKEYLALCVGALEQSALDGNWSLAFILSLMEDPPQQLFAERMSSMAATGRPFAPLIPPSWAATSLAYIKELEVLTTKKGELKKTTSPSSPKAEDSPGPPSPKRKAKFPRKPKAGEAPKSGE